MYMLSIRRREAGKDWAGIPEDYKHFLDKILSDTSRPAELGRVFLAWNIPFLIHIDTDWTRNRVLPMLDWSKDQRTAEQAWHGFLGMGRLSREVFQELRPLYEGTFPHVSDRLGDYKDVFIRQIAKSCFLDDFDPLNRQWLPSFLLNLEEHDRTRWAFWVGDFLKTSNSESKQRVWKDGCLSIGITAAAASPRIFQT